MAVTIEFQQAAGRVFFDGGLTEEGKIILDSDLRRGIDGGCRDRGTSHSSTPYRK